MPNLTTEQITAVTEGLSAAGSRTIPPTVMPEVPVLRGFVAALDVRLEEAIVLARQDLGIAEGDYPARQELMAAIAILNQRVKDL